MKKWNSATLAAVMAIVLLTAGCGGGKESGAKTEGTATPGINKPAEPSKPVKLLVITPQGGNMEWFMTRYGSQIQKKYPHYEFEVVESVGNNVQNLVIEQRKVDLIISSVNNYRASLLDLYGGDISDLIAKQKYDLSRLEPSYIEAAKVNGKNQNGLPLYDLRLTLYYNKDIFDKFGVPYLKNHMTWEEMAEVATKLTRNDGGVQYRGFVASPNPLLVVNPLSIPYTDELGEKAVLQTDPWKSWINMLLPLYKAPGYDAKLLNDARNVFVKEKTSAMFLAFNSDAPKPEENVNWDAVSLSELKSLPGVGSQPYPVIITVAPTSQHRDESFQSIAQLLTDEVQTAITSDFAAITPLKNQAVKDAFGRNVAQWKGKNVSAISTLKPAAPARAGVYDSNAAGALNNAVMSVIAGETDLNSALRTAEEQATKKIAEAIQMKK
ncbi:ABC transporter substrate-binding protein [Paenibacillus mesophilus]|uniref:ABC transporter substrate-binding protein n=1 Tax=Paenibacillus mesophilus TaxID=2582849 RepID=UPI00130543DF|nr:ABC transporter substrate-binding protein [Paenibacillus mesophilus]